jgi:TetR/AcrR family transcriptional regulator, copper-responsive repressor
LIFVLFRIKFVESRIICEMVQKEKMPAPRRRGRPRAYDPEQALLRAAETFWQKGYDGTSLDDLAAATGMNRPSLYAAFGDKRDLYLKTLARYRDDGRAMTLKMLADDPPLRVFLERFYKGALDLYLAGGPRGCYSIGTAATQAAVEPKVRDYLAGSIRDTDAFLTAQFRKARERGEIAGDPAALAPLATATLHALAVRARAGLSRRELNALAVAAIDTICGKAK